MIPKSIKVFGLVYKVEKGNLNNEWGLTDFNDQIITIAKSQTEERMKDTLCHEIGHCIIEHFRSAFEGCPEREREEMACDGFSHFKKVLDENPKLRKYLF